MKNIRRIFFIVLVVILFILIENVQAAQVNIYSDKEPEVILPNEQFYVTLDVKSEEDSVYIKGKLEYDKRNIEIVIDEADEELAKIEVGDAIFNSIVDKEGNFIITTIKGKSEGNTVKINFKVKENVKVKNSKIKINITEATDTSINNSSKEIIIGKKAKISILKMIGCILGLITIIVIIYLYKRRR